MNSFHYLLLPAGTIFRKNAPVIVALLGITAVMVFDFIPSWLAPRAAWLGDLYMILLVALAVVSLYATEFFLHTAEALDSRHCDHQTSLFHLSMWLHRASATLGVSAIPLIITALIIKRFLGENKAMTTVALCIAALGVTLATDSMELFVFRRPLAQARAVSHGGGAGEYAGDKIYNTISDPLAGAARFGELHRVHWHLPLLLLVVVVPPHSNLFQWSPSDTQCKCKCPLASTPSRTRAPGPSAQAKVPTRRLITTAWAPQTAALSVPVRVTHSGCPSHWHGPGLTVTAHCVSW